MDNIALEPFYTTNEVPGKCLRCLAEKQLSECLFGLLGEQTSDEEIQQRYETLLQLLQSPDFEELLGRSEKLLSQGKQVKVRVINNDLGKLQIELITD